MTTSAPSVAVSGATSFTGAAIACAFAARGWRVAALCPRRADEYTGLRAIRLALMQGASEICVHHEIRAEDGGMVTWVREHRPTIWINHHHHMENFRSADYDTEKADRVGILPLEELTVALVESGAKGIVHSGTFFEPGEGGTSAERATAYGRSKQRVWEALRECAAARGLSLSKVVIPNPIGPFENADRVVPILIRAALAGEAFSIRAPEAVSDYLPGTALAERYVEVAERLLGGEAMLARPSGMIINLARWAEVISRELIAERLKLRAPQLVVAPSGEPTDYRNPVNEQMRIDWNSVWDHYADELLRVGLERSVEA